MKVEYERVIFMGENKLEVLSELMKKMGQASQQQQVVMKHIVALQSELEELKKEETANKLSDAFSHSSQAEEVLKNLAHDLELEINRLKNEAA